MEDGPPGPARSPSDAAAALEQLARVMARLRDPQRGCAWDLQQTFGTIAPYTIEEAYEVADAIARHDMDDLRDELGDLQLQVVFHACMAEEAGHFTLADVIEGIVGKMVRRHPHVFGSTQPQGSAPASWEAIKAVERSARRQTGALAGVALALPALQRAEKLQRRAAQVGFDWPDASGPRAKVFEEIAEVDGAVKLDEQSEEIGDLLFAVVNWSRHLGIDGEASLHAAAAKFERRFAVMEALAPEFATLPIEQKEQLWRTAKAG